MKDFHIKTLVRYDRGRKDEVIVRPVRFAYTYAGQTWLILEWKKQSRWLPLPARNWVHADDGSKLGEFIPFNLYNFPQLADANRILTENVDV